MPQAWEALHFSRKLKNRSVLDWSGFVAGSIVVTIFTKSFETSPTFRDVNPAAARIADPIAEFGCSGTLMDRCITSARICKPTILDAAPPVAKTDEPSCPPSSSIRS